MAAVSLRGTTRRRASSLVARNVTVAGRRTSVRLEPSMWEALREISRRESKSVNELVTEIDQRRAASSLTGAIRVFLLGYFRDAALEAGGGGRGKGPGQPPV
jgi:predicted DNA-binding ribbon-helix-helix protein